ERCSDQTIRHRRTHVRNFAKFLGKMPTVAEVELSSIKKWGQHKVSRGGSRQAAEIAMSHLIAVVRFADPTKFPGHKRGGDKTGGKGCPQAPCCDRKAEHGKATPHTDLTRWALPCIVQCAMEPS